VGGAPIRGAGKRGRRQDDVHVAEDLAQALLEPGAEPVAGPRVEVPGAALEGFEVVVSALAGGDAMLSE